VRYRILSKEGLDSARAALDERKKVSDLTASESVIGSGEPFDDSLLETIASRLRKIQAQISKDKDPPEELDRRCFDIVHESLPRDELLMLGDMGFWTRFAITKLADVVYARFPGRKGRMNLDNFGLGSRKECWPYKLWVRGEVSFDERTKDKYALGRHGGVDIWTSHVHRQNFMSIRPVFRGVLAFQYPKELKGSPLLFEGEEDPNKRGVPGFRTLIKRLRENWASVEYSCLTDSEAAALVRIHGKGLHRADDKSVLAKV
jgi:hypothetical protein